MLLQMYILNQNKGKRSLGVTIYIWLIKNTKPMMRLRSDRAVTITNAVESNPNIVATCEAELKGTRKDEDRRKMARIEKD